MLLLISRKKLAEFRNKKIKENAWNVVAAELEANPSNCQ